jgi:hypothetical protein
MMNALPVSFLFRLEAFIDEPIAISPGPQADRVIVAPTGGVVEGPAFKGEIVSGPSSEWATLRADGTMKADVRLVLRNHDQQYVLMTYNGIAKPDGENLTVIIAPLFETAAEEFTWLNSLQTIGIGKPTEQGIAYDIYQINIPE